LEGLPLSGKLNKGNRRSAVSGNRGAKSARKERLTRKVSKNQALSSFGGLTSGGGHLGEGRGKAENLALYVLQGRHSLALTNVSKTKTQIGLF